MQIEKGSRVWFSGRKTPYRVMGFTKLNGEKAVELIRQGDYPEFNRGNAVPVARTVAIADLLKTRGGWKERWVQLTLL